MKTATPSKLKSIVENLQEMLPQFAWTFYHLTDPAIAGLLDPPCHIIRGTFGPFTLDLHADGEWTANGEFGPGQLDMNLYGVIVARQFLDAVSKMPKEFSFDAFVPAALMALMMTANWLESSSSWSHLESLDPRGFP